LGGEVEDTQDKVRRNLVVFSAAIVIGWFLDLKLAAITQLFVSASDLNTVDAIKLWLVTFVVLVYLFLRYKFDAATNSQLTNLSIELGAKRRNYLSKYIVRKIAQINRTGRFNSVFGASLMDGVNREIEKFKKSHSCEIQFRLQINSPWDEASSISVNFNEGKPLWDGTVGIAEEYLKAGSSQNLVISSGQRHDFSIPLSGRIWITTHSIIHVASYSKSAVDLILPIVVSGLALVIVACKLAVLCWS
jgi:hypothetical protein